MLKRLFRWVFMPILAIIVFFNVMVAALLGIGRVVPVTESAFMMTHRLSGGTVTQRWVGYDDIAKSAKQAAIASEDSTFNEHNGFDFQSMEDAIRRNEATGRISRGGSTISQQLAKNLFLTSHRSYIRKAEEAVIVVMMESIWDKKRILEVYLNVVEFGEGIYGIEAAAQHYYGKSAKNLSNEQSALLISMLPNPKYFQKNQNAKRLRKKQRIILRRMQGVRIPRSA